MPAPSTLFRIAPGDSVAVALEPLGARVSVGGATIVLNDDVPAGHKVALRSHTAGADVVKYGYVIGRASQPITAGDWVHGHNLRTALVSELTYRQGRTSVAKEASTAP